MYLYEKQVRTIASYDVLMFNKVDACSTVCWPTRQEKNENWVWHLGVKVQ